MLRFSIKPLCVYRSNHSKRTMNMWTLMYLWESVKHENSRKQDLKLSIEDSNVNTVRLLLTRPHKYTKTYLETLIPMVDEEMKHLESDLHRPIKNGGGFVLGVCIIGSNGLSNIGLPGFVLSFSCILYSLWPYPKQHKWLQYYNIKQMIEQQIQYQDTQELRARTKRDYFKSFEDRTTNRPS